MKHKYFHKEFRFFIFRFSIYILHNKWTIRIEASKGWEK